MRSFRPSQATAGIAVPLSLAVALFHTAAGQSRAEQWTRETHDRKAIVLHSSGDGTGADIPHAEFDADTVADLLVSRYRFQAVRPYPKGAAPGAIYDAFSSCLNRVVNTGTPNEQIVLYYRGFVQLQNGAVVLTGNSRSDPGSPSNGYSVTRLVQRLSRATGSPLVTILLDVVGDAETATLKESLKSVVDQSSGGPPIALYMAQTSGANATWDSVGQSRMSYWLVDGLRGSALRSQTSSVDSPPDVELNRLVNYLSTKLRPHAGTVFVKTENTPKNAVVTPCRHRTLDELLTDLAEQMATHLREKQVKTVVVPDFTVEGGDDSRVPGEDYGPLLRYISTRFKEQLSRHSYGSFGIAESLFIRQILNRHRISPANIQGPLMTGLCADLADEIGTTGSMAVLLVSLEHRRAVRSADSGSEAHVVLRCRPASPDDIFLRQASGQAILNPSEWAMIGHSAVNQDVAATYVHSPQLAGVPVQPVSSTRIDPPRKEPDSGVTSGVSGSTPDSKASTSASEQASGNEPGPRPLIDRFEPEDVTRVRDNIQRMLQDSQRDHPLLDNNFPWRISMKVDGETLKPQFSENRRHAYVTVARGQKYVIGIENRDGHPVFLRLLVDGLNTLPERPRLKKKDRFEVANPNAAEKPAQYASLTNARAWYCDPHSNYAVRGFFTSIPGGGVGLPSDATLQEFVVTDARSSEAAAQGYFKDIGIITAAFYRPRPKRKTMGASMGSGGPFGTRRGDVRKEKVDRYAGDEAPGELLGVIHLRYDIDRNGESPAKPLLQ